MSLKSSRHGRVSRLIPQNHHNQLSEVNMYNTCTEQYSSSMYSVYPTRFSDGGWATKTSSSGTAQEFRPTFKIRLTSETPVIIWW